MPESMDWPRLQSPLRRHHRRRFFLIVAVLAAIFFGGRTALSYYVDVLWFDSLGYRDVFWKTLGLQWGIFAAFAAVTFIVLFGSFLALKRAHLPDLPPGHTILIGGQPVKLPVAPVLRLIALGVSLVIAAATGGAMAGEWPTLALFWFAPRASGGIAGPDFWQAAELLSVRLACVAAHLWMAAYAGLIACALAAFFILITGGARVLGRPTQSLCHTAVAWVFHCICISVASPRDAGLSGPVRAIVRRSYDFRGCDLHGRACHTHRDARRLRGARSGRSDRSINAVRVPRGRWLLAAIASSRGLLCRRSRNCVVRQQLYRQTERTGSREALHCLQHRSDAAGLRIGPVVQREFPAETTVEAADPANNQATLQNIRLWDWRALQDTLRQIQEIRTYYDFPDIDIDRYEIDGTTREVMLATRELNVDKLPESSRNWINEKLIYTHGYGITMNPVNGFTPEGLPTLILSNMPVQSTVPSLSVTRPEIYFGELTNTDVYVKTRQKEFNYPQGQTNSLTSYEGNGGILLGGFLRRILIALDRGDLAKATV